MPELPEVETVARQLAPSIEGRRVRGLRIVDAKLRTGPVPTLRGRTVREVYRAGKRVVIELAPACPSGHPLLLAVHLRMTGRLLWSAGTPPRRRPRHRARIELAGGELLFIDTRRFGTFDWYRSRKEAAPVGVEPLSAELTTTRLGALLGSSRQELKTWLLRQDRLVGVGNIYASEILYRSRLSPLRGAGSLEPAEVRRLRSSTRVILERAIRSCGTTFSDFQDSRGVEGSYQQYLAVYDREDEPCRRCREPIRRVVQQQRSTFHCPNCQT